MVVVHTSIRNNRERDRKLNVRTLKNNMKLISTYMQDYSVKESLLVGTKFACEWHLSKIKNKNQIQIKKN